MQTRERLWKSREYPPCLWPWPRIAGPVDCPMCSVTSPLTSPCWSASTSHLSRVSILRAAQCVGMGKGTVLLSGHWALGETNHVTSDERAQREAALAHTGLPGSVRRLMHPMYTGFTVPHNAHIGTHCCLLHAKCLCDCVCLCIYTKPFPIPQSHLGTYRCRFLGLLPPLHPHVVPSYLTSQPQHPHVTRHA